METEHISTDRMLEVIRNDDVMFTAAELKHFETCDDCFNRWAECIENQAPSDLLP